MTRNNTKRKKRRKIGIMISVINIFLLIFNITVGIVTEVGFQLQAEVRKLFLGLIHNVLLILGDTSD